MTGIPSNSQVYRILVIGRDVSELSGEANLLTQAGYIADLVVTVDQAVRRTAVGRYHLAVVSSTFTCDEQIAIRASLKQVKATLRTLLLGPEHKLPNALLTAVSKSLNTKQSAEPNTGHGEPRGNHLSK